MPTALSPGTILGGYRIEAVTGKGGMGVVYRATQLGLDRTVALKVIAPELAEDEGFRERFKRESRIAASIEHRNVIPVHEAGEDEGRLFITMRFIEGTNLRELIEAQGRLSPERAVHIVGQVCSALDAAHARGLVHRDIKPANVLIATKDGEDEAYLTDFGLTKHRDSASGVTATGVWVGTIDYMAPEQIEGQQLDARCDVYAVGCVLYHALTGDVPFRRPTDVATIFAHMSDPPPSPSEHVAELPHELDGVVRRAMAKARDERYLSAGDLARAALAALEGRASSKPERTVAVGEAAPVTAGAAARPTGTRGAVAEAPRRRRLPLVAAAVAGVAAVAVIALVLSSGGGGGDGDEDLRGIRGDDVTVTPISVRTPAGVALGEGDVWASSYEGDTISRIDPAKRKVEERIGVGQDAGPTGLAVGDGSVWVIQSDKGSISRVDIGQHGISGPPIEAAGGEADSIAVGAGAVWVVLSDEGQVRRIDPSSGKVVARIDIPDGALPGIVAGDDGVWVVNYFNPAITRIDPRTNEPDDPIVVGRPTKEFRGVVASGEGSVWVSALDEERVIQVDPNRRRVRRRIDFKERGALEGDIAVGAGLVWVVDETNRLIRLDPRTGKPFGRPLPAGAAGVHDIEVGEGAVWVAGDQEQNTVTRVGP